MSHLQVSVSNDGTTTIKRVSDVMDVPMPGAKRTRDAATAKYEFNTMKLGQCIFAVDKKAATAASQAFNSEMYAPARAIGRLSVRSLEKFPDLRKQYGQPDTAYGLWLVPHKPVKEGEKA